MTPIVEATGVQKRFGPVEALAGLDLVAPAGQVLAVLGPNGAGKTTFVRMIATLLSPDAGQLRVAGIDVATQPEQVRKVIGLAGQYAAVEPTMTGRENLEMVARLFGHTRRQARAAAATVLEQLGLVEASDRLVRTYSGGMRRKLDLGASLVGAPRLLLLDEPTTGLDPRSRIELWDTIAALVAQGTDVLLTTQYLDEADQLADRISVIDHGRAIAEGTPDQLKSEIGGDRIDVVLRSADELPATAATVGRVTGADPEVDQHTRRVSAPVRDRVAALTEVVRALDDSGITAEDIALRRPTLDEVFLHLTGRRADEEVAA